jgi:lipopolysaccharide transport system permease protein
MACYGAVPRWGIVCLPVFVFLCVASALAVGLWTSALSVKYRDIQQVVVFLTQMWMWMTPIVYSVSLVPQQWRLWYSLNPMVGVVEGFRWAILGREPPDWTMMGITSGMVGVIFVGGLYFFRRTEAFFADII